MANTIKQVLFEAAESLAGGDSPQIDAELLLAHCLQKGREFLRTYPDLQVAAGVLDQFQLLLRRRLDGEPVAYLLGYRDFWDIRLEVNSDVLIPRPETELLVETALELAGNAEACSVLDLGTGSGAIALALAHSRPAWQVLGVDVSEGALGLARRNAAALALQNVSFVKGNWCQGLEAGHFDVVLANPPYVAASDAHLQQGDLRFEPRLALVADDDGYADLFTIIESATDVLKKGAWLLLEHGYEQHASLAGKLSTVGYQDVAARHDLAGHERVTQARWDG